MSKNIKCRATVPSKCPHHGYPLTLPLNNMLNKHQYSATKTSFNATRKAYSAIKSKWVASGKDFNQADIINSIRIKNTGGPIAYNFLSKNMVISETKIDLSDTGVATLKRKIESGKASAEENERYEIAIELKSVFNVTQETFYKRRAAKSDKYFMSTIFDLEEFSKKEILKLEKYRDQRIDAAKTKFGEIQYDEYGMKTGSTFRHQVANTYFYNNLIKQIKDSVTDHGRHERRVKENYREAHREYNRAHKGKFGL